MELGLNGKVALVAAASKGLGKACALAFAREGASVAICGRDGQAIGATAEAIQAETGARVLPVQADVSRAEDVARFVQSAIREFGQVDSLVCNAGGPAAGTFEQITDDQWQQAVNLNLLSVVRLIRAALPYLRASGTGRIVNIASSSVRQPIAALVTSNTLRLGLHGLVKTCADEFAPDGILVNTVGPGRFNTDRVRSLDEGRATKAGITLQQQVEQTQKAIPLGRYGTPAEFARYVAFLGSPANTYVTGQALLVDGGMTRSL
jgi:3-oxoacyl-[acyl-carrier protein] reductase